ncbi:MAG TPA: HPr family phosphocarrier protein [Clostridiaceae bacterium]|nr:HPr family phosphocarrier protein [Clostridiaceae bacterium]
MIMKEIKVGIQTGLQSKTAAVFIQKASGFKSSIWIEKEERKANAKSLLGLLSLGIGKGSEVTIIVDGEDEQQALNELEEYLQSDGIENT